MFKVPSYWSFRLDLHEWWSKAGVKLGIWFSTTNPLKAGVKWGPIEGIHRWKDIFKVYKILSLNSQKIVFIWEKYECPKFWVNKNFNFGIPTWESRGKVTFGCNPCEEAQSILYGGEWCLLPKVVGCVDLVFEIILTKSVAPFPLTIFFSWLCRLISSWTIACEFVPISS
jgi:hypothetical protein